MCFIGKYKKTPKERPSKACKGGGQEQRSSDSKHNKSRGQTRFKQARRRPKAGDLFFRASLDNAICGADWPSTELARFTGGRLGIAASVMGMCRRGRGWSSKSQQEDTEIVASTGLPVISQDFARIAERCRGIVRARAVASATVALVPIPGLDVVADVALLARMIERINHEFGLTPQQIDRLDSHTRMLLYRSISGFGTSLVGKAITGALVMGVLQAVGVRLASRSVARYIPLDGQAFSASLSFAAVRYVGERHVRDCVRVLDSVVID